MKTKILFMMAVLGLMIPGVSRACDNFIAASEIPKAIALQPGAGGVPCSRLDPCVCFDGVDWETALYANGVFVVDPAKVAAKVARLASEAAAVRALKDAQTARIARLKAAAVDAATITELKPIVKDLISEITK